MPTYSAEAVYPYAAMLEQVTRALRGALRLKMPPSEAADWATLTITGPIVELDRRGLPWYAFAGTVEAR